MAIAIKTLGSGVLRRINADFQLGGLVLYAAPHPDQSINRGPKKTAMVTGIRFFNPSTTGNNIALQFVRYNGDVTIPPQNRPRTNALPFPTLLGPRELRVDTIPLVLEEGDLIVGFANTPNSVNFVISGIERDV